MKSALIYRCIIEPETGHEDFQSSALPTELSGQIKILKSLYNIKF